jgi:hypothetical protein
MTYREMRLLCDNGIEALVQLYGECAPEHFEPDCIACKASFLIRDLRELRDEEDAFQADKRTLAAERRLEDDDAYYDEERGDRT